MTLPTGDERRTSGGYGRDEDLLRSAQDILLARERERIRALEEELETYRHSESRVAELEEQIEHLQDKLQRVERAYEEQLLDLQTNISILNYKNFGRSESLLSRLSPVFSRLIGKRIEEDREEMAKTFSPIMGEAIRAQIRNSRQDMIDAIYPIIGESVQKSVAESIREIQRNIDARLRQTSSDLGRTVGARLRGVSRSELALRDALPFAIRQMFLIEHETGLLLASFATEESNLGSGLIGGMLTAIREFARESFGHGRTDTELNEIQYGNERIIIQSGQHAYLAVVINGIEPEGFNASMRNFVAQLHLDHESALRNYQGDVDLNPLLQPELNALAESVVSGRSRPKPMSRAQRWFLFLFSIGFLLFIGLSCFYLQFTIALLPVAFPSPTATATATMTPTFTPSSTPTHTAVPSATPSPSPTATFTQTPSPSPTSSWTPTATLTPSPSPTPTVTYTPSPTPTPVSASMIGNVYTLAEPELFTPQTGVVLRGTAVDILALYGDWARIEWVDANGVQRGWVLQKWINLRGPVPAFRITPTSTPGF